MSHDATCDWVGDFRRCDTYKARVSKIIYEVDVFPLRGRWPADVAGALAIMGALGLVVGLPNKDMREMLVGVLWTCLAVVIVGGALFFYLRRGLARRLKVDVDRTVVLAHGKDELVFSAPDVEHGRWTEMVTAGRAHRVAPLLWVRIASGNKTIVVRRLQGVLDPVPSEWPEAPPPMVGEAYSSMALDPMSLWAALR
jgi:hypothetical protein